MKLVFITVSSTALKHLIKAKEQVEKNYPGSVEMALYYPKGKVKVDTEKRMVSDIEVADFIFLDLMGTAPQISTLISQGLEHSSGQIVPYGNSLREHLKLGKFTAAGMKSEGSKKPSMESMKKMQSMAETMGKIMPGKMRDMRNYVHLSKYFSLATSENMYYMLLLILKEYGGLKIKERIQAPVESQSIALFDPKDRQQLSVTDYLTRYPLREDLPIVAVICSSNTYPTDTHECIRLIQEKFSKAYNLMILSTKGDFRENRTQMEALLTKAFGRKVNILVNLTPFRLGAGPMGGDFESGIEMLKALDVPYLHPFFMTRRTKKEWEESIQGCTSSETLISVMLPELDGALDAMAIGAMKEGQLEADYNLTTEELTVFEERIQRLMNRIDRQIQLKSKANKDKKIAIIGYNYPPGEGNLFGGAFLDTFASLEAIVKTLGQAGYQVDALTKEALMDVFTAGKAVNSGKYDMQWKDIIRYNHKHYGVKSEIRDHWGEAPGEIMTEENDFLIPGIISKNIFIGLQPTRGIHESSDSEYHDKTIPPHHQYMAFYQWLKEVFQADAIIHVGTHGTLEFLKGKECGLSQDCYPDYLIGDLPHIYLYYVGNPSEAIIAKRRSYANIVSYQPPVFVPGDLYGAYLDLATEVDNYHQALALGQSSASDIRASILVKAESLGFKGDLEHIEGELYRMQQSLIPKGLHVFGKPYNEEELKAYKEALVKMGDAESAQGQVKINQALENAARNNEEKGLLKVLSGHYNEAKLAGDMFRNPDVLPAGSNVYQFDPRLVPTAVAMERGERIADNTLQAYYEDHKTYPQSTAVILWGLETSRTQGESFAQILAYLGVKMDKKPGGWDTSFEIIPLAQLKRPRIDVTVNICGFFRDMFPNLLEDLSDLFEKLYDLDEEDNENYFKAHSKAFYEMLLLQGHDPVEAKQLAISRVFGPKEGEYGTSLTKKIETKNWEKEEEFGETFIASLKHVYNREMHGKAVEGLYTANLKQVDIVSQIRSSHEYEITDLDHYYEFFGGLSKSVEMAKGRKAKLYITDSTSQKPLTETLEASIDRGVRTRLLNPKWIDGMLAHSYHGGQKIYDRFENIMGLSATTNSVSSWIYDDLHESYVADDKMSQRMKENNPHAYMDILQQMMEYNARGYWQANEEQIQKIKEVYKTLEDELESNLTE